MKTDPRRHCVECNGYIRQQDFYDIWKQQATFSKQRSENCEKCESENWTWVFKVLDGRACKGLSLEKDPNISKD